MSVKASKDSSMQVDDEDENEEDNSEPEEEEDIEEEEAIGRRRRGGRGVSLSLLLADGILTPGEGTMAIDYLGKKFTGDLLSNGKIRWQETRQLFNSPSAWAIYCKKMINPEKKSGCGWASVKYKGKKLDSYKSAWYRKHRQSLIHGKVDEETMNGLIQNKNGFVSSQGKPIWKDGIEIDSGIDGNKTFDSKRTVIQHSSLGNRTPEQDPNTLVACTAFSALGKIQPFTVSLSTNCMFLIDFHCHLTTSEVVGYVAGTWDVNSHNLAITQAFPCKCRLGDKETAVFVEAEVRHNIEKRGLTLIGWYHSHPSCSPNPTLRDINCQMDYQIKMKGSNDAAYTPCIGIICSPYDKDNASQESRFQAYWVMPPPESRPFEYGKPMLMDFTIAQEAFHAQDLIQEMHMLFEYYKHAPDILHFNSEWKDGITYLKKLKASLFTKCPSDISETQIEDILNEFIST